MKARTLKSAGTATITIHITGRNHQTKTDARIRPTLPRMRIQEIALAYNSSGSTEWRWWKRWSPSVDVFFVVSNGANRIWSRTTHLSAGACLGCFIRVFIFACVRMWMQFLFTLLRACALTFECSFMRLTADRWHRHAFAKSSNVNCPNAL